MSGLVATPLTAAAFAPYGDVLEAGGEVFREINQGRCRRYHDLATLDFDDGRAGVSLFHAELRAMPCELELMERHPQGSQCFVPMGGSEYLVAVAPDDGGKPGPVTAFRARGDQAVNYRRGTWHAVLTPLAGPGLFAVIDRIGEGANLEEHWFDVPVLVVG